TQSRTFFSFFFSRSAHLRALHSFPTRRSSDLCVFSTNCTTTYLPSASYTLLASWPWPSSSNNESASALDLPMPGMALIRGAGPRSEEHTSELQSRFDLVCRLLLEKKKKKSSSM